MSPKSSSPPMSSPCWDCGRCYFLVKDLLDRLVYLSTGLAFIGVKLTLLWGARFQ